MSTTNERGNSLTKCEVTILDLRSAQEWQEGTLPGTQHIMLGDLADQASDVTTGKPILVYCRSGRRSMIGASILQAKGVTNVINLKGGYQDWAKAGLRTEHNHQIEFVKEPV